MTPRSILKVKVIDQRTMSLGLKYVISGNILQSYRLCVHCKGQVGLGQRSLGSRSNHIDQCQAKGRDIGRWAHDNVKLHFFYLHPDSLNSIYGKENPKLAVL